MDEYILQLKSIDKSELDEREFFRKVLDILQGLTEKLDKEEIILDETNFTALKTTLSEIGCVEFDDWKKEQEEKGNTVNMKASVYDGGLEWGEYIIHMFFTEYSEHTIHNIIHAGSLAVDWLKADKEKYLKNIDEVMKPLKSKSEIVYYQIAKVALMNWYKDEIPDEETAIKFIEEHKFSEIDEKVDAKSSIESAISGIVESFGCSQYTKNKLRDCIFRGANGIEDIINVDEWNVTNIYDPLNESSKEDYLPSSKFIVDTLFAVHDGWVATKSKKFNQREKKHQHMPSELIGWKEVQADLIFVRPIFEAAGIEVNEEELEKEYNRRVREFFVEHDIKTTDDLVELIQQGEEFYPALKGYGETLNDIKNPEVIREKIIPAIESKGIGSVEDVRKRMIIPELTALSEEHKTLKRELDERETSEHTNEEQEKGDN